MPTSQGSTGARKSTEISLWIFRDAFVDATAQVRVELGSITYSPGCSILDA